jgi:hypothetical protein
MPGFDHTDMLRQRSKRYLAEMRELKAENDRLQEALHGAWGEAYLGCLEGEDAERACSEVLHICMEACRARR